AAEHQGSGDQGDGAGTAECQHQVLDDAVKRVQRVLDVHGGDRRESVGQGLDDRGVFGRRAAVGKSQRGDVAVRRAAEGAGREHQDEIDAEVLPVDGAKIGDARYHVAAEHVDGNGIADLEIEVV